MAVGVECSRMHPGTGSPCSPSLFSLPLGAFLPMPALRKPSLHLSLPALMSQSAIAAMPSALQPSFYHFSPSWMSLIVLCDSFFFFFFAPLRVTVTRMCVTPQLRWRGSFPVVTVLPDCLSVRLDAEKDICPLTSAVGVARVRYCLTVLICHSKYVNMFQNIHP